MSKGISGVFPGLSNNVTGSNRPHKPGPTESHMHTNLKRWAEKQRSKLTGKDKKNFNTACVVYDESTGKYYYGQNGAYKKPGYIKNPVLFGDNSHKGILPKTSLNKYPVGNCAEVDAVNQALNAGAKLDNLHMTTIHSTKSKFGIYKESCENCTAAFKDKVKKNYSGWINGGK